MASAMRAGSIIIFAWLGATGCKAPEPTKDEVAAALVKLDDDAPAAGSQPVRKKAIVVEELLCERVDKTTHRCDVTWRWDTNRASATDRYSFTRKDGTWRAVQSTTP